MVGKVTTSRFHKEVLASDVPVVVDFYADWCAPCKTLAPTIERLSDEWENQVRFFRVDTDAEPAIARAYNISSIPALLLFERGEVVAWSIGVKPGYVIEKELRLKGQQKAPRDRWNMNSLLDRLAIRRAGK